MEQVQIGQRFSLLYAVPSEPVNDSTVLRERVMRAIADVTDKGRGFRDRTTPQLGRFLEAELGISLVGFNSSAFLDWKRLNKVGVAVFLDVITLCWRFLIQSSRGKDAQALIECINRIFSEERAAYTLDAQAGVHPSIDAAFRANLVFSVKGIEGERYSSARRYIENADKALLPNGDRRDAVRYAFDAVECVFKVNFKGATALNKTTITDHLKPLVSRIPYDATAKRASTKMTESLIDWADSCHNYRHAPGESDGSTLPPESLAILLVSQGLAYARWLADLNAQMTAN